MKPPRSTIEPERIQVTNDAPIRSGRYVLYWMQASQRAEYNHALEYAVHQANECDRPLVVVFALTDRFPEANLRHYAFMLEGLQETRQTLHKRGIQLVACCRSPDKAAIEWGRQASLIVTDRGYLRIQKAWREELARNAGCRVVQVESDVVVPVEVASGKAEYAAATLRPKLHRHIDRFLRPLKSSPLRRDSLGLRFDGVNLDDTASILNALDLDRSVVPVRRFKGGASIGRRLLDEFIATRVKDYAELRGDPSLNIESHMSPYLHFGQLSPIEIALRVRRKEGVHGPSVESYLEELIVRRELSINFVHFHPDYDTYAALPGWAKDSLRQHARDRRDPTYNPQTLEQGETHDVYWNAAMREMRLTGKMHNYMRMYWGKKIIEWTHSPEEAFHTAMHLNNKYFLDGRDPNSYAGIAWCFGKHDRPWTERPIFGKVRYMNAAGLKRKFDIETYVRWAEGLQA